jgi:hypothetical protein
MVPYLLGLIEQLSEPTNGSHVPFGQRILGNPQHGHRITG